jgi:hypothetical protein
MSINKLQKKPRVQYVKAPDLVASASNTPVAQVPDSNKAQWTIIILFLLIGAIELLINPSVQTSLKPYIAAWKNGSTATTQSTANNSNTSTSTKQVEQA